MAMAEVGYVGGDGGVTEMYFDYVTVASGTKPSWSNTPIPANKVYFTFQFSSYERIITNVNPTTKSADNSKCWVSSDNGQTWTLESGFYWTITSSSVELSNYWSSTLSLYGVFCITN